MTQASRPLSIMIDVRSNVRIEVLLLNAPAPQCPGPKSFLSNSAHKLETHGWQQTHIMDAMDVNRLEDGITSRPSHKPRHGLRTPLSGASKINVRDFLHPILMLRGACYVVPVVSPICLLIFSGGATVFFGFFGFVFAFLWSPRKNSFKWRPSPLQTDSCSRSPTSTSPRL